MLKAVDGLPKEVQIVGVEGRFNAEANSCADNLSGWEHELVFLFALEEVFEYILICNFLQLFELGFFQENWSVLEELTLLICVL